MMLAILSDGSVVIGPTQYRAHAGRVWIVGHNGRLELAFGGLRLLPDEPLHAAALRGMMGATGRPPLLYNVGVGYLLALLLAAMYAGAWLAQR